MVKHRARIERSPRFPQVLRSRIVKEVSSVFLASTVVVSGAGVVVEQDPLAIPKDAAYIVSGGLSDCKPADQNKVAAIKAQFEAQSQHPNAELRDPQKRIDLAAKLGITYLSLAEITQTKVAIERSQTSTEAMATVDQLTTSQFGFKTEYVDTHASPTMVRARAAYFVERLSHIPLQLAQAAPVDRVALGDPLPGGKIGEYDKDTRVIHLEADNEDQVGHELVHAVHIRAQQLRCKKPGFDNDQAFRRYNPPGFDYTDRYFKNNQPGWQGITLTPYGGESTGEDYAEIGGKAILRTFDGGPVCPYGQSSVLDKKLATIVGDMDTMVPGLGTFYASSLTADGKGCPLTYTSTSTLAYGP